MKRIAAITHATPESAIARMNFDRVAPHYGWMERLLAGRSLQRCRTALLDALPTPANVLIPGEGHGRMLAALLAKFPEAQFTCIDSSPQMIRAAERHLHDRTLSTKRVQFIEIDMLDWVPPTGVFDLIVTTFFLDCFPPREVETIVPKLATAATSDAHWLNADFRPPPSGPTGWRTMAILRLLYAFFRITAGVHARHLTTPDPCLAKHRFTLKERRILDWGLFQSDLWQRRPAT